MYLDPRRFGTFNAAKPLRQLISSYRDRIPIASCKLLGALRTCAGLLLGYAIAWKGEYKRGLEKDRRWSLSHAVGHGQYRAAR